MDKKSGTEVTLEGVFVGKSGRVRDFYVRDYSYAGKRPENEDELEALRGCRVMAELSKQNDDALLDAFMALTSAFSFMGELAYNMLKPQYAIVKL